MFTDHIYGIKFVVFKGGLLVNVVRGCNCPLLIKTIRGELEQEHKVIDGKSERVPVSIRCFSQS